MNFDDDMEVLLDSFDPEERRSGLKALAHVERRRLPTAGMNVNMHFHSFFSFNAEEWSPTHIAWEARKAGLYAAGLCDFDVLDGLEEFIEAGLVLGLRATVNLETRAYLKEYAGVDISSPGEPGVIYVMGAGFAEGVEPDSPQGRGLEGFRERARARNEGLVGRINPHLAGIDIDYEEDVLPLTPSGSATERHIIRAYINKSKAVFEHASAVASFWAKRLDRTVEEVVELLADPPSMEEAVRTGLVKRGGVGYEQPSPTTFPPVEEFIRWVASCGAIPMITWLDGTSPGEKDGRAMLECMAAKGGAALNIIPDRVWNVTDPSAQAARIANLNAIVAAANRMHLPINIGTEMNRQGLPFVDDLDGEALRPHKETFLRGARIMVGHTVLLRYAGMAYVGARASAEFGDAQAKNVFFESVGGLPPLTEEQAGKLEDMGVERALTWLRNAVK